MKDIIIGWIKDFLNFQPTDLFGDKFVDMLKIAENEMSVGKTLFEILMVCGMALTTVFFLLEINNAWAFNGKDLTLKDVAAPLLKYAVATIFISNGWKIITCCVDVSNDLIDKGSSETGFTPEGVQEGSGDSEDGEETKSFYEAVTDYIKDQEWGVLLWILLFVISLFIFVAKIIAGAMFYYKAILFKMEFLLRLGFTPVAFSDIYNGLSSTAIKWLKGTIAMGMYGISFFVIQGVGNVLALSCGEIGGVSDILIEGVKSIIVPFAMIGMLSVARQISQEITA